MKGTTKKILVRLSGGLGNQLFQLSASLFIAKKINQTDITLDARFLGKYDSSRSFELDFLIKYFPFVIVKNENLGLNGLISRFRIAKVLDRQLFGYGVVTSGRGIKSFDFTKLRNVVLDGYFQNPIFLMPQSERTNLLLNLKRDFSYLTTKSPLTDISNKVSIHIRRGDYVSSPRVYREFITLNLDYYRKAIKKFPNGTVFYVFGDDAAVVTEFAEEINGINVPKLQLTLQEEFVLMADSAGYIIANSTFSWWAAFLGFSKDKIVISPAKWFVDEKRNLHNSLQLDCFELI